MILGGSASYMKLKAVHSQRALHFRFEQLENSDFVKQAKPDRLSDQPDHWQDVPSGSAKPDPIDEFIALPKEERGKLFEQLSPDKQQKLIDRVIQRMQKNTHLGNNRNPIASPQDPVPSNFGSSKYEVCSLDDSDCYTEVNKGSIKTIHWTKDYRVNSIDTEDGQTLHPTPAPSLWAYLLAALLPVFGFFVPWGALRGIGWVWVGFSSEKR